MATTINSFGSALSIIGLLAILFVQAQSADFDVTKAPYSAPTDGVADAGKAISTAWTDACAANSPSKVIVPAGRFFANQLTFGGPCKGGPITFAIDGTIVGPEDTKAVGGDGWVIFKYVDGFTLTGKGAFDGRGTKSWKQNECSKTATCESLPTNIRFDYITNGMVDGISSIDSKMFHINVLGCKNLTLANLNITAPGDSANTDGIHIGRSEGITILNPSIKTGDDCVSLGDGSKNINITGVTCGPGHGISIGSLGKFQNEEEVTGIFVKNCTLTDTMNGVRIKTWPASPVGAASDMHFEDITMTKVSNPVLIDQGYCPWNQCKAAAASNVKLSKVSFRNIKGSSTTKDIVKLSCSPSVPCEGVEVADIDMTYSGPEGPPSSNCTNVKPTITGKVPPGC